MIINLVYDSSAQAAPQSFRDGMQSAATQLQNAFSNNITVNIAVSYGQLNGVTLQNQNESFGDIGYSGNGTEGVGISESYQNLRSLLANHETSADDVTSVNALPNTTSLQGHSSFVIGGAQAKALGVTAANASGIDGQVWMGSSFTGNVLIAGALHEITHAMGRITGDSLDLFRYSDASPTTHVFGFATPAQPAFFSINGGTTKLADFGINSDPSDFLNGGIQGTDPFNETVGGSALTAVDLKIMNVLGFSLAAAHVAPTVTVQNVTVAAGTSIAASSLITAVTNPSNDSITQYGFWDSGGDNGHFTLSGITQASGQWLSVSAGSLDTMRYVGATSPGSEQLFVQVFDATTNTWSASSAALTAATTAATPNLIDDSITKLYVGYYNRAPDPAGETYWVGQLNGGMPLTQIAQSYSVQTESTNQYAFLANPSANNAAAVKAFVDTIYSNLFNRAPDTAGEAYWIGQLQTGASTVGGAILNIISGAQGNDALTVNNKVTVGDYYDTQVFSQNVQFSVASAQAALSAVNSATSSITAAQAIVDAYVRTAPAGTTTASQSDVNLVGILNAPDLSHIA